MAIPEFVEGPQFFSKKVQNFSFLTKGKIKVISHISVNLK